jgi:hypothetical protein
MTRRPCAVRGDERAVSTVLGAVLLFGLFIITLVTVQVKFVPVWDEDREARHMDAVLEQLSQFTSDLDRQVENGTGSSLSDPLRLEREAGFRFFSGGDGLPASVAYTAAASGSGVSLSSPRMTVLEQNGLALTAIADSSAWIDLDNVDDEYSDIEDLRVLRVRIPWPADTNDCNTDLVAILHIYDVANQELARVTHTCHDSSSERSIETEIFYRDDTASAFQEVSGDTEAIFQNADAEYFYIDLLRSELLLEPVLASLDGPLRLQMEDLGLDASYVLVFDDSTGGTIGGGGTLVGRTVSPYPATPTEYEGGTLVFSSSNQEFVEQQYVVEHGAILRVQSDGAAMVVAPRFDIQPTVSQTRIDWNLPTLTGVSQTLSGTTLATLTSSRSGDSFSILAGAAELTLVLPTDYPDAWQTFFERELVEAGLTSAEYSFPSVAGAVSLTITGTSSDPLDDDLLLEFVQADLDIDLATSG